jgi:hypothetical protein
MRMRRALLALTAFGGLTLGAAQAAGDVTTLYAVLLPGNEVSAGGQANQGDPGSSGSATIMLIGRSTVCFGIIVNGTDQPTLAHIHPGEAGVNNPPLINFIPPASFDSGDPGAISGCVKASRGDVADIRKNPSAFYVNVHTQLFPAGAMRGQLF